MRPDAGCWNSSCAATAPRRLPRHAGTDQRLPPRYAEAVDAIERIFGGKGQQVAPKEVRQLRQHWKSCWAGASTGDTPLLRQLFDALWNARAAGAAPPSTSACG